MKNLRAFQVMVATSIVFLLVSCWIPEEFEVNVSVNKDGSYAFTYEGILTLLPVLVKEMKGNLTQEEEKNLEKKADFIRQEFGFKDVKYLGKGRYKVLAEKTGKPGEQFYFMSKGDKQFFSIEHQADGTIKISAARFSKEALSKLKSIGAKVNGTLTVSVERGVRVIKHNAQSEPKLFGFFGSYEWEIKSVDAEPFIIVQPSA